MEELKKLLEFPQIALRHVVVRISMMMTVGGTNFIKKTGKLRMIFIVKNVDVIRIIKKRECITKIVQHI